MNAKAVHHSSSGNVSVLRASVLLIVLCAVGALQVSAANPSEPVTPTPTFSPAQGTFTSDQNVAIMDSADGAVIYYTTDGTDPDTSSPVYSSPILINQTTVVKAFAIAPGDSPSYTAVSLYTVTTGGGGSVNYGLGFSSTQGLALNGNASVTDNALQLTDGNVSEVSSAWYTTKVNVQAFTQDFSLNLQNARGDGMTFVIQNAGQSAIGRPGAGLGYGASSPGGPGGIRSSIAIKFDLFSNYGEGTNSTGLYLNGASPTIPAVDITGSGVTLRSGDVLNVHMTYDGFTLYMLIRDAVTSRIFQSSWRINIPSVIGSDMAYVGFTGASGRATAVQQVLNWTFASPFAINYGQGFTGTGMAMNGNGKVLNTRLRLTDGVPGEISSAYYNQPVNIATFSTNFGLQDTSARADGLTFVIQNAGPTAIGPGGGGLGYGATHPGGRAGIPNSVAIKFDLFNNQGEGSDSTGLYTDGASPTIPALDMTSSGINLHSGHTFNVAISYDGTNLTLKVTDIATLSVYTTTIPIDIPTTVGGNTAYVGFTAASGGASAIQEIVNWDFGP